MNGVRTTFMRRGYLLTALSALLLLAASAGTALAQNTGVTITGPSMDTVTEGGTATYRVDINGFIAAATDDTTPTPAATATVTLVVAAGGSGTATEAEPGDFSTNEGLTLNFNVPANARTTAVRFRQSQSFRVRTNPDPDAEDETLDLTFTLTADGGLDTTQAGGTDIALATAGTPARPNELTIDDDETQSYVLSLAPGQTGLNAPREGRPVNVTLVASPSHVNGSAELTLNLDKPAPNWSTTVETIAGNTATVNATTAADDTPGQAITIVNPANDRNRVPDTVTLTAHSGRAGAAKLEDSLTVTIADGNVLQAVKAMVVDMDGEVLDPQPTSLMEGKSFKIAVMPVDKDGKVTPADEDLEIALMASGSANAADYRLGASKIEIDEGATSSDPVDLIAEKDEDVGMEMLVLDATVSGQPEIGTETSMSAGVLSLGIDDATDKKIQPKSETDGNPNITGPMAEAAGDDGLNPGESFMVEMDDLFTLMPGYTATYGADSDGSAVSISERGDVLTIEAEEAGTSTVTVTATASMAGSSFTPSQSVSNVAQVAFDVTVVDKALVVTVAADPMEIDEGGMSTITAMANRAVVAGDGDVTVDLTATEGGMLSDDSITIAMGEMSGSVTLTANEDDGDYEDGTVTVVASGSGIDGQVSIAVSVMDNDEAPEEPEPTNAIEAKPEGEAYPIITGAIEAGSGGEGFNPGESAMVDAADLFTVMDGYNATYAASVDGDAASASVSGSHVTVMADMLGEAKVTITGTATAAGSSFQAGQPDTNVATVTFAVMVVDKKLTIELHGPENVMEGNLVEGQSYRLTVQANRVVREDTMVSFGRDRAMSDAEEGTDYELNDVTILAGSDSVSATLDVLEDGADDAGHGMGEQLVIYAMAGDAESNSLTFTIWDHAVPALPLIAQLLLALFLMAGGARLYRRRQG